MLSTHALRHYTRLTRGVNMMFFLSGKSKARNVCNKKKSNVKSMSHM